MTCSLLLFLYLCLSKIVCKLVIKRRKVCDLFMPVEQINISLCCFCSRDSEFILISLMRCHVVLYPSA